MPTLPMCLKAIVGPYHWHGLDKESVQKQTVAKLCTYVPDDDSKKEGR